MEYIIAIIWVSSVIACLDSWFRFCKKDHTPTSITMIMAIPIVVIAPFIACAVFFINQFDRMENK